VIDGFPRTALQVDFVKLLHDKLMELSLQHADTPEEWRFPRPSFKVGGRAVGEYCRRWRRHSGRPGCRQAWSNCFLLSFCSFSSSQHFIPFSLPSFISFTPLHPGGHPVCGRGGERAAADAARSAGGDAQQARDGCGDGGRVGRGEGQPPPRPLLLSS
jgi:hypothetical protein